MECASTTKSIMNWPIDVTIIDISFFFHKFFFFFFASTYKILKTKIVDRNRAMRTAHTSRQTGETCSRYISRFESINLPQLMCDAIEKYHHKKRIYNQMILSVDKMNARCVLYIHEMMSLVVNEINKKKPHRKLFIACLCSLLIFVSPSLFRTILSHSF